MKYRVGDIVTKPYWRNQEFEIEAVSENKITLKGSEPLDCRIYPLNDFILIKRKNYQVGDYVTRIKDDFAGMNVGDTDKIIKTENNGSKDHVVLKHYRGVGSRGHKINNLRSATEEEIQQYKQKYGIKEMTQFYVDTKEDQELAKLIVKRANKAGYLTDPLDIKEYSRYLAFNYWDNQTVTMNNNPDLYNSKGLPKYTIDQALEFFSKPKEPQFKVGDWVTVTKILGNGVDGWLYKTSQRTFELLGNPAEYFGGKFWTVKDGGLHAEFRLATPEEIEKATAITILGHKVTIDGPNVLVGCKTINKEDAKVFISVLEKLGITQIIYANDTNHPIEIDVIRKIASRL